MSARVLASGIGFTEGPVWTSDGRLLVTSVSRGLVYRVGLDGDEPEVEAEPGGGPNGLAEGAGVVYVAQNGHATIRSRSPRPVEPGIQVLAGGEVVDLAGGCSAPNDCVVGPDGRLWFTDPPRPDGAERSGRIGVLDPASRELETFAEGIGFPNGIAFADAATLLVADSSAHRILRFDVAAAARPEVAAVLPGSGPDGIALDADGMLYVAAFDADRVLVVDRDGRQQESFDTGDGSRPTNVCFAGEGLGTLVVTAASGGRVLSLGDGFAGRPPTVAACP